MNVVPVVFCSNVIAWGRLTLGPFTVVEAALPDASSNSFCPKDCVDRNTPVSRMTSVPNQCNSRDCQRSGLGSSEVGSNTVFFL